VDCSAGFCQDGAQALGAVALAICMLSEGTVTVEAPRDRLRDDRLMLIVMDTREHLTSACVTLAVRLAQTSAAGYQPRAVECAG